MVIRSPIGSIIRAPVGSGVTGQTSLLGQATSYFGGIQPYNYWDFTRNRALIAGTDVGPVTDSPGWSVSGGALVMDSSGLVVTTQTISCTANITGAYTLFVEFLRGTDTGAIEAYFQAYFSATERAGLQVNATDSAIMTVRAGGGPVAVPTPAASPTGSTVYKLAGRVKADDYNAALNGTLGTLDTAGVLPTTPATFQFGSNNGASFPGSGNPICRAATFIGLTDAQLQTITAA